MKTTPRTRLALAVGAVSLVALAPLAAQATAASSETTVTATGGIVTAGGTCFGQPATITRWTWARVGGKRIRFFNGTPGKDVIIGTHADDLFMVGVEGFKGTPRQGSPDGDYGDDLICGRGGNDRMNVRTTGGAQVRVDGGSGNDTIWATPDWNGPDGTRYDGKLLAYGGPGDDYITGDDGNDLIHAGSGTNDRVRGGLGINSCAADSGTWDDYSARWTGCAHFFVKRYKTAYKAPGYVQPPSVQCGGGEPTTTTSTRPCGSSSTVATQTPQQQTVATQAPVQTAR